MRTGLISAGLLALACCASAQAQPSVTPVIERAELQAGPASSAESVSTTFRAAQALLVPQATVAASERAVTVVMMHGQFVDHSAAVRKGGTPPSGATFTQIVGPEGEVIAEACCDRSPSLQALGSVTHYASTGTAATVARGHHFRRARAASWGTNNFCTPEDEPHNHHCYMLAEWPMSGGERVRGTQVEIDTADINVPEWTSSYFVTNEEWASWGPEKWIEIGQMGGNNESCCGVHWFYAAQWYKGDFYATHVWEIALNTWANYGMVWAGGSSWCYTYGPHWESTANCYSGFSESTQELEVGLEAATEKEPANSGKDLVNAQFMNGNYYNWNFAQAYKSVAQVCYSHYGSYPGDINFGTC